MNTHTEPHDYPDALLDRGLAELLGNETPPDLSERILAAAQLTATEPVTLAQGNATMSTATIKQSPRLRSWAILAATIACIATVIGLSLPARNAARRLSDHDNLAQVQTEKLDRALAKEQASPQAPLTIDTDGALWPKASPADIAKAKDEVMIAVTPHIIIQEEEEERLGVVTEEASEPLAPSATDPAQADEYLSRTVREQPRAPSESRSETQVHSEAFGDSFVPSENMGLNGLINDAYAQEKPLSGPVAYSNDAEIEAELRRRARSAPPVVYPDAEEWQALAARKKSYGAVDLSGRSRNESSELEAGDKFSDSWGFKRGREKAEGEVRVHPTLDLVLPLETLAFRDQYTPIHENPFITATGPDAVSTFSIDVDTASYANVRQFLQQSRRLPPPDAVRIEELINYFAYDYTGPTDDTPFAANMEIAGCPWNPEHRLARIAIKGIKIDREKRPQSNLVFLIDVSGSMSDPNKLPLLVEGMKVFTRELGENDRVAIVVYASSEGLALNSTRGNEQETILAALDQLRAGGSTAGGAGINLAYQVATDNFIEGGTNRVILCTDGDFNVGVTNTDELTRLAEEKAKSGVFLTVLGFGRGNLNDAMMESISGKGNGNYHYVDNLTEARKVLVEEMTGTLITIAKDVKIQVEFNPAQVAGYRLIGYENRMLKTEDFNNDKKDAGEIGAGHTVTALYEIVPTGKDVAPQSVDPLKYQQPLAGLAETEKNSAKPQAASDELLTLKLRYKLPDADTSTKLEFPITTKANRLPRRPKISNSPPRSPASACCSAIPNIKATHPMMPC